ncbi:hypothetical protein IU485_12440 [Nocardia cyriacigeorgica]|uniref:hypothetical protein n=1 Tax=Nocardia cyriacigeorgica TaxID=135487 RepID=UPI0018953BC6|nr:hypothetical protein [Nocardia cyriacigeorgica]MBF6082165.1 hypothetical protein [Nocardia cyriacigeorgica]
MPTEAPPARPRRRLWLVASLVILVVCALGVGGVVVLLGGGDGPSVEQRGRSALAVAQLRLLDTPATHFTGTVKPSGASAGRLRVDLTVTNVGDATGTVAVREGVEMDYLGVGGKSFLRGSEQEWLTFGEPPEDAARYADVPVLIGPERFGFDLASTLAPARLALALDPEAERGADVTVGEPIEIDGHESTPVTSGSITTYLSDFDPAEPGGDGSDRPAIDRIVSASSSGESGEDELPEFTLEPEPEEADDALGIYEDLPGRVNDLGNAVDSRISVGGNVNGQFLQNPCLGVCTIQFVITNTVNTSRDIRVTTVRFDYTVSMQSSVPVALGPGCNGSGTMPANGSTTLTCSATYDPQLIPAGQTRPITASIQVTVRALDPQQVTELQDKTADRGRQVKDITQDAPNSYRRYAESGGTLPQPKWTQRYDRTSTSAQERGGAGKPMREDQVAAVSSVMDRLGISGLDKQKTIQALRNANSSPMGAEAADIIGKGHLAGAEGFKDLVSKFRGPSAARPAAMQELRLGDELYRRGHRDLVFGRTKEGQGRFDIDVGIKGPDGRVTFAYQAKEVASIKGLRSATSSVVKQLMDAPAERKVGVLEVAAPSTALDTDTLRSLTDRSNASGIAFVLRFSDDKELIIPDGAKVFPE